MFENKELTIDIKSSKETDYLKSAYFLGDFNKGSIKLVENGFAKILPDQLAFLRMCTGYYSTISTNEYATSFLVLYIPTDYPILIRDRSQIEDIISSVDISSLAKMYGAEAKSEKELKDKRSIEIRSFGIIKIKEFPDLEKLTLGNHVGAYEGFNKSSIDLWLEKEEFVKEQREPIFREFLFGGTPVLSRILADRHAKLHSGIIRGIKDDHYSRQKQEIS